MKAIRATLQRSDFFQTHEVIGSSLLFVHDQSQASVWLIDFAKTITLPPKTEITHSTEWSVGNHEDGYLIGINNLIQIFEELQNDSLVADNEQLNASFDSGMDSQTVVSAAMIKSCRKNSANTEYSNRNELIDGRTQANNESIVKRQSACEINDIVTTNDNSRSNENDVLQ